MLRSIFIIFSITLILFLIVDIFLSIFVVDTYLRKDCVKYSKFQEKKNRFYSYSLDKNCKAYEVRKTVKTYKVYTDKNGYRYDGKTNIDFKTNENLLVLLGDSFTYGYGLDYNSSIAGIISRKTNYSVINLAVPGYGPSMSKFHLNKLIQKTQNIKKIIYIMDLTDVYDESNKWMYMKTSNRPVIMDQAIANEIEKDFNLKAYFKLSRMMSFEINKFLRNIRKKFSEKKRKIKSKEIKTTFYGSFTYLDENDLDASFWKNSYSEGIKKIYKEVNEISQISNDLNSEFYIVIFPWAETLEFGENKFNWQKFGKDLCEKAKCKKLINLFPEFKKIKKINQDWKNEIYFLLDIHLNKNGNQILANKIINEIK